MRIRTFQMVFIFIEKYISGELIAQQISYYMIIHYFSLYFKQKYHTKTLPIKVAHVKEICS